MLCFENILKTLGSPNNARETVLFLLKVETFGAGNMGLGSRSLTGSPPGTPRGRPPRGLLLGRRSLITRGSRPLSSPLGPAGKT